MKTVVTDVCCKPNGDFVQKFCRLYEVCNIITCGKFSCSIPKRVFRIYIISFMKKFRACAAV